MTSSTESPQASVRCLCIEGTTCVSKMAGAAMSEHEDGTTEQNAEDRCHRVNSCERIYSALRPRPPATPRRISPLVQLTVPSEAIKGGAAARGRRGARTALGAAPRERRRARRVVARYLGRPLFPRPFRAGVALRWWRLAVQEKGAVCRGWSGGGGDAEATPPLPAPLLPAFLRRRLGGSLHKTGRRK